MSEAKSLHYLPSDREVEDRHCAMCGLRLLGRGGGVSYTTDHELWVTPPEGYVRCLTSLRGVPVDH